MKNTIMISLILVATISLSGCFKLEQQNPNQVDESRFWKTEQDLYQGSIAAYDMLQNGLYDDKIHIYYLGMSDEGTHETNQEFGPICRFQVSDYNYFADFWNLNYAQIGRAYQVIDRAPGIEGKNVSAITAEMRFLVSLAYFNLVTYFGENVAFVDKIQYTADQPRRAENGELWAFMEEQLKLAIPYLPLASGYATKDYGRVTKGAAQALLAKIYMQQHKYTEAEPLLKEVIDSKEYELLANYGDNFIERNTINSESVFQVNFIAKGPDAESDDDSRLKVVSPGENRGTYGDIQPTEFILKQYLSEYTQNLKRDPRLDVTLFWLGSKTSYYGETYNWWKTYAMPSTVTTSYLKYSDQSEVAKNPNNVALNKDGGTDFIIIRYADVLLSYAECLNENGKTAEAYQYVDIVRARSNMKTLAIAKPKIGTDKVLFLTQLQHERVVELAGECVRLFDQKRWGIFNQADSINDRNFVTFTVGQDEIMPIPTREIDYNPNLRQNPGY